MSDVEAGGFHRRQDCFRRRRCGGDEFDILRQRLFLLIGRGQQCRHHDRRAAQMRDFVGDDGVVDRRGAHRAQADMGAGDDRERPRKAPAVAVEHRQRPQIDRVLAHGAGDDIGQRQQISAAMMIDHAFGVAGCARRIIERDRIPFVLRHQPGEIRIALAQKILVFERADALAGAGIFRIVVVDDQRLCRAARQRVFRHFGEFTVGDQDLGFAVIEREADDGGIEPGIDRIEHGPGHRDTVMRLQHRRDVGQHHRDGVAAFDAAL